MNNISKLTIIIPLIILSQMTFAVEAPWKQSELTQEFMEKLSKDQCIEKTVVSLKNNSNSEEYMKTLAGISGDCITWAKGTEAEFCKSYAQKYIRNVCSVNALDARSCVLINVMYENTCFTAKYK